ncbi:hypothetical protein DFH09DRAFT_1432267 [Mycena vulgaris]|nr:hypothetical protein DFH09DRAFT_1432267 [Mycena vulgaris]
MRLTALTVLTMFALARAAPADPLNIAARDLLKSFEGSTPEEQQSFVSSHCADLTPSKITYVARTEPDIAAVLHDHGVTVDKVIAYVKTSPAQLPSFAAVADAIPSDSKSLFLREGMRNFVLTLFLAPFLCALVGVGLSSGVILDLNQTLFTPENDNLPEGTYIATGVSGVVGLADYIDSHPDKTITRLLISDSTVQDESMESFSAPQRPLDLTVEEEDKREEIRHHNAKLALKRWRTVRDIEVPLKRVLDTAAPSLEAFTYLTYIDRAGRSDPRAAALLARDYPSLTYLTFVNRYMDGGSPVLAHPSRFPAITHLRLDQRWYNPPSLASLLDDFPRLTHLLITQVGSMDDLPRELNPQPIAPIRRWWELFKAYSLGIIPPVSIPRNLTVIVQPGFHPNLALDDDDDDLVCGNPGIEYDSMIQQLADEPLVHLKFPTAEEYLNRHAAFPLELRRAIVEFKDQARGGGEEWAIPGPIPDRWWNGPSDDANLRNKAEGEL